MIEEELTPSFEFSAGSMLIDGCKQSISEVSDFCNWEADYTIMMSL
jgi:hypothetical protein